MKNKIWFTPNAKRAYWKGATDTHNAIIHLLENLTYQNSKQRESLEPVVKRIIKIIKAARKNG